MFVGLSFCCNYLAINFTAAPDCQHLSSPEAQNKTQNQVSVWNLTLLLRNVTLWLLFQFQGSFFFFKLCTRSPLCFNSGSIIWLVICAVTSLKCYVCSSSATNALCNQNNQQCQAPLDTCMTVVDTLGNFHSSDLVQTAIIIIIISDTMRVCVCASGNMMAIVKQCSSRATCTGAASTASVDSNGNGNKVSCCSGYDYCNKSGAGSVHTYPTLLLLTAGLLLLWTHWGHTHTHHSEVWYYWWISHQVQ